MTIDGLEFSPYTFRGDQLYTNREQTNRCTELIGWGNLASFGGIPSMFSDNNTGFTNWLADLVNGMGLAWWVKIDTKTPPAPTTLALF